MTPAEPLWRPSPEQIAEARITRYLTWLEQQQGLRFDDYESLWRWSTDRIEDFWESIWTYCGVISHQPYDTVLQERTMPGARWFEGATLNYAEHALAQAEDEADRPAILHRSELRGRGEVSWHDLKMDTGAMAATLRRLGLQQGDRAAAYMPNLPETVTAMLAVTSLGAIWSCASPDMGAAGVLDRFSQIEPKVLFAVDGYRYGGRDFDRSRIVAEMISALPTLRAVIFLPYLDPAAQLDAGTVGGDAEQDIEYLDFADALRDRVAPAFVPVPFSHPLWIVYSSGTTGMPKPIVHGHGGVVIQTLKAGLLHADARPGDRAFWFTSTNWIMWNSVVNGLLNRVTILLFDGNPGHPDPSVLWRFAAEEKATSFGTSPAFIALCRNAGIRPGETFDLGNLRSVGCTGSPLPEESYHWVYENVASDIRLGCISGGTDPGACFLTTSPILPVYAGEMQCRELGIATQAFDDDGKPVIDEVGELVVTEPMPSMPLFFWGDEDGSRYHESYFDTWPGVWRHGDWLRLIPRPESVTGIIYGRSDSTINRHGIRMGTSEIYRVVEEHPGIADSLVIDLEYLARRSFMILFVVTQEGAAPDAAVAGQASLAPSTATGQQTGVSADLGTALCAAIRSRLSARHVPDAIIAIPAVPRTLSGKKLEVPIRKILLGHDPARAVNRASMSNPEVIDWFVAFARAREAAGGKE